MLKMNTKEILAQSLKELLKTKSLEEIKVSDITDYCGASRTTFYKHFRDKYDLVNWIYMTNANRIFDTYSDSYEAMYRLCLWVMEHAAMFRHIVSYRQQNALMDYVIEFAVDRYSGILRKHTSEKEYEDLLFTLKQYSAGGIYLFFQWINNGFITPPEVLSRRLLNNLPDSLNTLLPGTH